LPNYFRSTYLRYLLSMCCAYSTLSVTDLKSDHSIRAMSSKHLSTPQRRKENVPVRTVLPSREPSKEDLELAQHLIGHAQGIRGDPIAPDGQTSRSTPSPAYDASTTGSTSPSAQQLCEIASRSSSLERSQQDASQSYQRAQSHQRPQSLLSGALPAGQVCR
jgi:GATA-binding protein